MTIGSRWYWNRKSAENILPAPLYFVGNPQSQNNQIWRLERDDTTRTKIVEEPLAQEMLTIVEFDVSPSDGALAYLVQGPGGTTLVYTNADGENRKELLPAGSVNTPRWSPDGKTIAVAISQKPVTRLRRSKLQAMKQYGSVNGFRIRWNRGFSRMGTA